MARSTKEDTLRRRDARENHERLIEAARRVFASSGFEASLAAIASEAGVGRATLYRNFPDKFALVAAIFEDNLVALETLASEHAGRPDALLTLLAAIVEHQIEAHALFRMLLTGPTTPDISGLERRTKQLLRPALDDAKAAGRVRDDLGLDDVMALLTMISGLLAADTRASSRRQRASRALELLLHGILPRT